MRLFNKKIVRICIAGVMAVVMICLGVLIDHNEVTAKDTLQGIQQIVQTNTKEKPFKILEIVPDKAMTAISDNSISVSQNGIEQSMGTIGYYIGGQEPVILARDLVQFSGAEARKSFVERLYNYTYDAGVTGSKPGVLAEITEKVEAGKESKDTRPLYFKEYKEYYESQYTVEEIKAKLLDGSWKRIGYNGLNDQAATEAQAVQAASGTTTTFIMPNTTVSGNHIDLIPNCTMEPAAVVNPSVSGNFILTYQAVAEPETGSDMDPARNFFNNQTGSSGNPNDYIKNASTEAPGEFDPGFLYESAPENAAYAATFATVSQNAVPEENRLDRGYVADQGNEVSEDTLWTASIKGKQVYEALTDGDGVTSYEYRGYITGEEGKKIIVRNSAGEPVPLKKTHEPSVSPNGIEATRNYFIMTFHYESPADGNTRTYPYYYVKSYYKYSGGEAVTAAKEYKINSKRPLVPNMSESGLVTYAKDKLVDERKLFIFEFDRGRGYYLMNLSPAAPGKSCYVTGMNIYFEGGFYNNEWFKKQIFDRDAGAQCDSLYIEVNTIPANQITETDIANADMFCVANSGSNQNLAYLPYGEYLGKAVGETPRTTFANYGYTKELPGAKPSDLSAMNVLYILKQVSAGKKPIVFDHTLLDITGDTKIMNSNAYKLAKLLTLNDLDTFYGAQANTTAEVTMQKAIDDQCANGVFITDAKHYVRENKYCYDLKPSELSLIGGQNQSVALLNQMLGVELSKDVVKEEYNQKTLKRFQEVLDDIENENLYRETDGGKAPLATVVSEATTLRYIINYAKKRPQTEKDIIQVLEIQPCASYDLSVTNDLVTSPKDATKKVPKGVLTYKKGAAGEQIIAEQVGTEIKLTKMTTAELIGKNTDLNATYDLIYIGLNTDLMNVNATTKKTVYNDTTMNGLIYSNVGDSVYCRSVMAGLLNTDYENDDRNHNLRNNPSNWNPSYGRYRFSGNDINEETRKKLENFIRAGYPILLENDILKVDENTKKRTPNADVIDNSSYLYEFLQNTTDSSRGVFKKDMPNLIRRANMTENLFNWYLNLAKPVITLSGKAADAQTAIQKLSKASDGYYYLTYEFVLSNASAADTSTTFDCKLYIDINADGKFSKTKEKVKDIVITDTAGNGQEKDGEGRYSLAPGKSYIVKRAISDEYAGIIPWELELVQKDNDTRRANKTGFYEIRKSSAETINILQIASSGTGWRENNLNLEKAMKNNNSRFKKWIENVDDIFDVKFTTITSSEYKAKYDQDKKYLDQFDMLILGFADCYMEADNSNGAMTAIRDYIASGRSVLFTHDTTSFLNSTESKFNHLSDKDNVTFWGYSFNTLIRDKVGLDRYGVLASGDIGNARKAGSGISNTDGIWGSLTDKAQNGKKETAYVPRSGRTKMVSETQGFSYVTLSLYSINDANLNPYRSPFSKLSINNGQYSNEKVTKVNNGQITMYPYVIPDTFTVANTHNQYYQVDLEADDDKDGESDIVVWYTLSDPVNSGGDAYADSVKNDAARKNQTGDAYFKSPNDVRNNYYIFNKGNITYSGVGHRAIDNANYDDEVKLFVNTMIAAYKAGLHAPKISVLENKAYNSRKINNLYLSYEKLLGTDTTYQGIIEQTQDIFFAADDVNLVEGDQNMSVKYYFENPFSSNTIMVNGEEVKVTELTGTCPLYEAANNAAASATSIDSSKVYRFAVPINVIRTLMVPTATVAGAGDTTYDEGKSYDEYGNVKTPSKETKEIDGQQTEVGVLSTNKRNAVRIYIEVTATLKKPDAAETQVMTSIEDVALVRTQLFDLE